MKVRINHKEVETSATNILQLHQELSLPSAGVAIAIDNNMLPGAEWENTAITQGADIIIIKAVCGG